MQLKKAVPKNVPQIAMISADHLCSFCGHQRNPLDTFKMHQYYKSYKIKANINKKGTQVLST